MGGCERTSFGEKERRRGGGEERCTIGGIVVSDT